MSYHHKRIKERAYPATAGCQYAAQPPATSWNDMCFERRYRSRLDAIDRAIAAGEIEIAAEAIADINLQAKDQGVRCDRLEVLTDLMWEERIPQILGVMRKHLRTK